MTMNARFPKAFGIWFRQIERLDPASYHRILWHWNKDVLARLGTVLKPRKEKVDRNKISFTDLQPITVHFDGSIDKRGIDKGREYTMDLFFAHPGDIVVAKIDLKNGAVGIAPDWKNIVLTNHFAIYEPDLSRLIPEYFLLLIQSSFLKSYLWRNKVGAEGRKEVKLEFFESIQIPLPPLETQRAIVAHWQKGQNKVNEARRSARKVRDDLNEWLYSHYYKNVKRDVMNSQVMVVNWAELDGWDLKSARAAAFRLANQNFHPLSDFVEEATELVKPYEEPEKEWAVYGVNNKEGVFFSHYQKGKEFNTAYKKIRKDWFFHNPTRSSVGSLGIVPDVPEDAVTSPEYQVWKIKQGLIPGYVATLIGTPFFISLIQFHRVGAVKQRLYVENLLKIRIPVIQEQEQGKIAEARNKALVQVVKAGELSQELAAEVEAMILGTKKV